VQDREDKRVQGKVFISESPCVVEHDLGYRRILDKETLFSRQRQRRHRIKKLFRTFIKQGGDKLKILNNNNNRA